MQLSMPNWIEIERSIARNVSLKIIRREMRQRLSRSADGVVSGRVTPREATDYILGDRAIVSVPQRNTDQSKREIGVRLLKKINGVGDIIAGRLIDVFGEYDHVINAQYSELVTVRGVGASLARRIMSMRDDANRIQSEIS